MTDIVLYTSEDGLTRLDLRVEGETVWLSQLEIAELFQTTKQNVSLHAKNIFEAGEWLADSVVKDSLTTAADGKNYRTTLTTKDKLKKPVLQKAFSGELTKILDKETKTGVAA